MDPAAIDLPSILAPAILELRPNGTSLPFPRKIAVLSRDPTFLDTEVVRTSLPCPREKPALLTDPMFLVSEVVRLSLPFLREKAVSRNLMFLVTEVDNLIDPQEHLSVET